MSQGILELKLTIKADEAVLNEIHDKLTGGTTESEALGQILENAARQVVTQVGVETGYDVDFHSGQVLKTYLSGGGLSAREWMETDLPPEDLNEPGKSAKKS